MPKTIINAAVYIYIFICVALLLFNIGYVLYVKMRTRRDPERVRTMLQFQMRVFGKGKKGTYTVTEAYREELFGMLRHNVWLRAFHKALVKNDRRYGSDVTRAYLMACADVWLKTATCYCDRSAMERAYLAYIISVDFASVSSRIRGLGRILLEFIKDGDTIYVRENVLKALSTLGDARNIERALLRLEDRGIRHHTHLLTEQFLRFNGDRVSFLRRMWACKDKWNPQTRVALIRAMTTVEADFHLELIPQMDVASGDEIFALMRYFKRHPHRDAKARILRIASGEGNVAAYAAKLLMTA